MSTYLKSPEAIYARSFEVIRAETCLKHLPENARAIAMRVIHACGMTDVAQDLVFSPDFVTRARHAMRSGAPIFVDAEMVRHGIIAKKTCGNEIICTLNDPTARDIGMKEGTTRSAAAISLWRDRLAGSLAVIGNAPTALFALLEMMQTGGPRPAAIIGFAVGFVGAAESKERLIEANSGVPFVTLRGRRGGSAMAAAVVNALMDNPT